MNPKQQFADVFARENATTHRVIHSMPASKSEFRPYPSAVTARELAAIFPRGQWAIAQALTGQWQWPPQKPAVPDSYAGVLTTFDATARDVTEALAAAPDARLQEKIPFITGPKQVGDIPVLDLMWFMLMDSIHHRGQFSVYLRAAGEKVPSIYGPTADERWM